MDPWKKTFYASFAAQVCSIMGFSIALPFTAFYVRELGITEPGEVARWAGNVNAAAAITMAIFAPIWGVLADRYGRRLMVMRSMFGGAVVLFLMGMVQNVHQLFACRLLQGVLTGTVSALLALVASESPRERAGYTMGMMQSAVFIGFSIGPTIGGFIADAFGYRVAFSSSAVLLVAGGLLIRFATTESFRPIRSGDRHEQGSFGEVLAATGFLVAVFALLTLRFANSLAEPIFALFVEEIRGPGPGINKVVGNVLGIGAVAAALGAAVLGRFSDEWGHKRLLVASCLVAGTIYMGYVFATSVTDLWALRILFGLSAGGIMPAANAIIRYATDDKNMGKAYGITAAFGAVGWALGPWAGGNLAAAAGYRATFILTAGVLVFAALLVAVVIQGTTPGKPLPAEAEEAQ